MRKRIILGILLFLLFLLAFGLIYLNNVYLPIKVKGRLAQALSAYLNYNVEIGNLKYNLIQGVIIQDIAVYDKVKDKENTILTIKEVSGHILILPLLKERKIIVPIMHIDSPYLYVHYQQDNKFNFYKVFLPRPKPQTKPKIKFSFFIYKINIFKGSGVFTDEYFTPQFTKTIPYFNLGLTIGPLTKISFLMEAKLLNDKQAITKLSSQGDYNLTSQELNAKINVANLILPEFNPYLAPLPLSVASGTVEGGKFDLKFKDNLLNLKGNFSTKGLMLKKAGLIFSADLNITPELSYSLDKNTFNYQANLQFLQANLTGLKYLDKLNNISGDMGLSNDKLWTNNLKLQALDSNFLLKGTLEDFSRPFLKINLACEQLSLDKLLTVLPAKPEGLNLSGVSKADINIEGYLKNLPAQIEANLEFKEAKLQTPLLKNPLDNIQGKVSLTTDTLNWLNLSFNYLNTAYTSAGKLVNFKAPQVNFDLASQDLNLKSDIKIKDKLVKINSLSGKYLESEFDIKGDIDTQDNTNPALDLYAKLALKPSNAYAFLPPAWLENLKKAKLDGILNIKGSLIGKTKDYKNWNLTANAASDTFSIYNLKLNELSFSAEQKNGLLNIAPFTASVYSGTINLDFVSNLKPDVPTYALKFNGSDIDLAKLKLDTNFKDKDIAGILNADVSLNGEFKDLASLKGAGSLSIKGGRLWQFNLFKGLGELFLLPDYEKVIFKEAQAGFTVQDKYISTESLRLTSNELNLDCQGKLGLDATLDFTVYTEVNKNLIRDSADIRKFTTAILGGLSNAITIKVGGTIQKPTYKIVPVALDVIKNIKDFLLGK